MNQLNKQRPFIGTGWSFPPTFSKTLGSVIMVTEEQDIKESLLILLTTQIGERVMNHQYGAGMKNLLFESLTTNLKTYITDVVRNAVLRYEPRVDLDEVEMIDSEELEGKILVTVYFTIRETNSRANIVFPYYKNEGTNI